MKHDNLGHGFDAGTAADVFGTDVGLIEVWPAQGPDAQRGAYDWHPLTIKSVRIGELRDDANGMTIHINDGD